MLATEGKISGDSHPDVKKRKTRKPKKTNLPPALFLFLPRSCTSLLILVFQLKQPLPIPPSKDGWRAALQDVVIHLSEVWGMPESGWAMALESLSKLPNAKRNGSAK